MLFRSDPQHYAEVDLRNVKRMLHALEVCYQTGQPFSKLRTGSVKRRSFDIVKIRLQLRVHFAFLKCPIVADNLYGYRKQSIPLGRHFLHAYKVRITLPGQAQASTFEAPLPDELANALKELEPERIK